MEPLLMATPEEIMVNNDNYKAQTPGHAGPK